jgi:hypothetical protein
MKVASFNLNKVKRDGQRRMPLPFVARVPVEHVIQLSV